MVKKVWNIFMSSIYLGMGCIFIFWGTNVNSFPKSLNYTFGTLMAGYGVFRAYRAISLFFKKNEQP
jgi:hypothetical protein